MKTDKSASPFDWTSWIYFNNITVLSHLNHYLIELIFKQLGVLVFEFV